MSITIEHFATISARLQSKSFAPGESIADGSMKRSTRQDALYRLDNLIGKPWRRARVLFAVLNAFPLTRCRCLILAANGLSFMFSHE